MLVTRPKRILVVAHRTAATPTLLTALEQRAAEGPRQFTLLVPRASDGLRRFPDPADEVTGAAQDVLELALPLIEDAVGAPVDAVIGDADPLTAIRDATQSVEWDAFDEVVLSTLPRRVSRWLRNELADDIAALGLQVTVVVGRGYAVPARRPADVLVDAAA